VYQEFRKDFRSRLIDPAIQEAVKAATAKFTAEELITKRPEVKEEMRIALNDRLLANGIIVKDISIVNFAFSPSFNQAIEEKQVAEQRALQAERDLQRIEIEKEQAIAAAEGEAEAIRIKAEALRSNPDLIELNAVEQWNGILPTYLMGDAVPFLNIQ
jgi:regulator of protease activity HflC (stomatin/prohibitin superfamily)